MDHRRREEFPAISNYTGEKQMGKLSIFIDESGDFGEIKERPAYYLVTFVFHDQNKNIDKQVLKLEESVKAAGFEQITVYYDNGQSELSAILNAVFSIWFSNVEFRKAQPQKYRLLQAADFICTMELLRIKKDERRLSRSEGMFFYKPQELKKTFLRSLEKKKL